MQGTKLPRKSPGAKLWIAGVSTIAILLGCETEPVKEQAANSNATKVIPPSPRKRVARPSWLPETLSHHKQARVLP